MVARARNEEATRARILGAALESGPKTDFAVREMAAAAGVTVQTVYSHFGSRGGLIQAAVTEVSRRKGLWDGIGKVWGQRDGRTALQLMLGTTFRFWHRAWPFISMMLKVRRSDPEFDEQVRRLDESRLADLVRIFRRLDDERLLRKGLQPDVAAALAFAFTTPYVYEELVVSGRLPLAQAETLVIEAVMVEVMNPAKPSRRKAMSNSTRGMDEPRPTVERTGARAPSRKRPRAN